jgi:hypothetical protein
MSTLVPILLRGGPGAGCKQRLHPLAPPGRILFPVREDGMFRQHVYIVETVNGAPVHAVWSGRAIQEGA